MAHKISDRLTALECAVREIREDIIQLRQEIRGIAQNEQAHLRFLIRVLAALALAGAFGAGAAAQLLRIILGQ